jgi:type II secretory pathway component PulC
MKIKNKKFLNFLSNIMKRINLISISTTLILIFILSIIFFIINYNLTYKNKENMTNKCCTMKVENNSNDEKIVNLSNKSNLALHNLCCNNPELLNCDC